MEFELKCFLNEIDFDQGDCKLELHELFGTSNAFPLVEDVVLPEIYFPCSNENIHNVPPCINPQLLSYGGDDSTSDLVLPNILRLYYFKLCQDQEEDIYLQVINPPAHVGNIVEDNVDFIESHHILSMDVPLYCINLEEDAIPEDTKYASRYVYFPTYIFKEDVIIDTPPQEIIFETLYHEMMVMLGYQPMIPLLCQVMDYPPSMENDEFKVK